MTNREHQRTREEWLVSYKDHLERVRGLALATQRSYLFIADRFLRSINVDGPIGASSLTPEAIIEFVRSDASPRKGQGPSTTTVATRSFLRFLVAQGVVRAGLEAAIPRIRYWRQASLPPRLTEAEIDQVLSVSKDDSARGMRNYALLLLFARLGLRADEAARLQIEDFDWSNGYILIRAGKTRSERRLPLFREVADAMLRYLKHSRPVAPSRHIFVQSSPPFGPYKPCSIGKIIKRLVISSGIQRPSSGAHIFRHTVASNMVNRGATFKDVADLLGHQSLRATAVYAKLDLQSLAKIALPWPAGEE